MAEKLLSPIGRGMSKRKEMALKKRKCKVCKDEFKQTRPLQTVCSWACATQFAKKKEQEKRKAETRRMKEDLKTYGDWLKDLQKVFNRYIRLRDKDKGCISCGKPLIGKYDAGHYRTVGACPELRFEEFNVYGQCVHCNQHKHGNIVEYRIRLVERIGQDKVEWLEGKHEPLKLSMNEIKELLTKYKRLCKGLENG